MKVLIADDSPFILLICRQTLEKAGYEVVGEAHDGMQAVELCQKLVPDLVVMDIAMPKKNGFEATQMVLQTNPRTKILAMSAVDEDWVKTKAIESGCYDFIAKPFDTLQLLDSIEKAKQDNEGLKYG